MSNGIIQTERRVITTEPVTLDLPALVDKWCPEDEVSRTATRGVEWLSATTDFVNDTLVCLIRTTYGGEFLLHWEYDPRDGAAYYADYADGGKVDFDEPLGFDVEYSRGYSRSQLLYVRPAQMDDLYRAMSVLWNAVYQGFK